MKILVIGPSWVGDMCMAQSLFIRLEQMIQDVTIDVVAPAWSQGLLERMPQVRQSIVLPFQHGEFKFFKRYSFGKALRSQQYDWSIVLPGSWKSAVIPFAAGIYRRTGWLSEQRYILLNEYSKLDKKAFPYMVQRYLALGDLSNNLELSYDLNHIKYPQLRVDEQNKKNLMESLNLNSLRPIVGLCPGAEFGPSKMWPKEYYAALANQLIEKGFQVWILGSPKDKVIGEEILKLTNISEQQEIFIQDLTGKTQLVDVIDLMHECAYVVGNDSGLMHIASAVDTYVVVVYGSTSPDFTPPLTKKAIPIRKKLECSPCFERECPLGHFKCMKDITPEFVLAEMNADLFLNE